MTSTDIKNQDSQPASDIHSSLRYDYVQESFDESSHYGRLLKRVGSNKKVLELGSSTGFLSEAMTRQFGCTVTGIEVDKDAAEVARAKGLEVFVLDLDQADLAQVLRGRRFDVVFCADVLEHLRDPVRTLTQIRSLLADDGYVVSSIPHVAHGDIRLSLLTGRLPYRPVGLLDHTHVKFFTRALVEELFEESGFKLDVVERNRWGTTRSEVQGRLPSTVAGLQEFIAADPESETYQFIVRAVPYPQPQAAGDALPAAQTPPPSARVDVVVIDQDFAVADDLYQKYLSKMRYPSHLLRYWFVQEGGGLNLLDKPKGEAAPYQDNDFRTFRFASVSGGDPAPPIISPIAPCASGAGIAGGKPINGRAEINIAQTLAQVARGSDAKYIFVLLANALPGTNCLAELVKRAESLESGSAGGSANVAGQSADKGAEKSADKGAGTSGGDNTSNFPLIGARPELRSQYEPAPAGPDGEIAWHGFSAMLIPRDFLTELKALDPNLWTVRAQAADMCFRAWAAGRRVIECESASYFSNGPADLPGDYDYTVADGLRLRRRWGTARNIVAFAKYSASTWGAGSPLVWFKTANHVLAALAIETPLTSVLTGRGRDLVGFGGPGASQIGRHGA